MTNHEFFELWPFGSLTQAPAKDVPLIPQGEEADLGWEVATARIEANSLRLNAIAKGNKPADMPGWMTESIGALHANIGREHGVDPRESKISRGFHDGPVSSSQANLQSVAEDKPRISLDDIYTGNGGHYYLYKYDAVIYSGESFNTNYYYTLYREQAKGGFYNKHFAVYTDFVLTGSDDIHVAGHDGEHYISTNAFISYYASSFDAWNNGTVTYSYVGNSGNNTFDMTWGFYEIDLSAGGNNHVVATGGLLSDLTFGSGDDFVQISGGAVAPNLMFLTAGNNRIEISPGGRKAYIYGGTGDDTVTATPTFVNGGYGITAHMQNTGGAQHNSCTWCIKQNCCGER